MKEREVWVIVAELIALGVHPGTAFRRGFVASGLEGNALDRLMWDMYDKWLAHMGDAARREDTDVVQASLLALWCGMEAA